MKSYVSQLAGACPFGPWLLHRRRGFYVVKDVAERHFVPCPKKDVDERHFVPCPIRPLRRRLFSSVAGVPLSLGLERSARTDSRPRTGRRPRSPDLRPRRRRGDFVILEIYHLEPVTHPSAATSPGSNAPRRMQRVAPRRRPTTCIKTPKRGTGTAANHYGGRDIFDR